MRLTKTLAQVANDIENGNSLHEYNNDGATIKAGNFESFGDFLNYYRQHYRPLLEAIRNGDTLSEQQRHILSFMADDLIKIFWDKEDSDKSKEEDSDAVAVMPDVVILSSSDEYTREKFRERHEKFYKLSSYWKGDEVNTNRESDLKKHYDRESLAVHFLLSHELFYSWRDNRHREDCLDDVRQIYPNMTADELHNIRDKYAPVISEIYG